MEKDITQAKARLQTEVGTIEIEGTEAFVKTGIADLVKQIRVNTETEESLDKGSPQTKKSSKKPKKGTVSLRNVSQPKLISDLLPKDKIDDFRGFFEEKSPANHQEAFTVIAYWLKYNLDLDDISIDEVWTVHKILDRKGPKNWIQVLRDTKSKKGWLDSVADRNGRYAITPMGETLVEHDLSSKKK